MATFVRSTPALLRVSGAPSCNQARKMSSFRNLSKAKKIALGALGALAVGGTGVVVALNNSVAAHDLLVPHPPQLEWPHKGMFAAMDTTSIRRGYEVYKNVCAACHSMEYICYRNLVGVSHTEKEAKAEAKEAMITDGPNDQGEMFTRAGKLSDVFPAPYPNEEAARAANNGAYPPDLSFIVQAREGNEDYIFHILTAYMDPPAGVELGEGQYFNPYFPGGAIAMAKALYNEIIEYEDGTPATMSQLSKDVVCFLAWAAEPYHDERKKFGIKALLMGGMLLAASYYWKRHKFSVIKSRKIDFIKPKK